MNTDFSLFLTSLCPFVMNFYQGERTNDVDWF